MTKKLLVGGLSLLAAGSIGATQLVKAAGEDDTSVTTINVTIGETIAITSGPSVTLNPVPGGVAVYDDDTVTVSTNAPSYQLTLEMNTGFGRSLTHPSSSDTIGPVTDDTALAVNTWGYATDDADTDLDDPTATGEFRGVPAYGSAVTLKSDADAANDETVITYGARVGFLDEGTYTGQVLYTAITN